MSAIKFRKRLTKSKITIALPKKFGTHMKVLVRLLHFSVLMTLTTVIKPLLPNFLGRAIVISNFVRRFRNFEKHSVSLKTLLQQGISEPEFYGDLVYRFKKKNM